MRINSCPKNFRNYTKIKKRKICISFSRNLVSHGKVCAKVFVFRNIGFHVFQIRVKKFLPDIYQPKKYLLIKGFGLRKFWIILGKNQHLIGLMLILSASHWSYINFFHFSKLRIKKDL